MQRTYQFSATAITRAEGSMVDLLSKSGPRRRFAHGSMVQQRGDAIDGFWLIMSGRVMLCRFAESGDVTVFAVLGSGDLFGELAYFSNLPRQVDAVADGDAELLWIGRSLVDRLLADEPQFAQWLLGSLSSQLSAALDRIERDRQLSAEARIAATLGVLADREGPEIVATQQEVADYVGVSRVTAGQVLARLACDGLIERGYGRIRVHDRKGLADRVGRRRTRFGR